MGLWAGTEMAGASRCHGWVYTPTHKGRPAKTILADGQTTLSWAVCAFSRVMNVLECPDSLTNTGLGALMPACMHHLAAVIRSFEYHTCRTGTTSLGPPQCDAGPRWIAMPPTNSNLVDRLYPADRQEFSPGLFMGCRFCQGGRPTTRDVATV